MCADKDNSPPSRTPEGKEGAGYKSANDHQKTVSGKKQHGPEDKVGQDAGGHEGSKGQNVDPHRSTGSGKEGTGKEPGDIGDYRGRSRTAE